MQYGTPQTAPADRRAHRSVPHGLHPAGTSPYRSKAVRRPGGSLDCATVGNRRLSAKRGDFSHFLRYAAARLHALMRIKRTPSASMLCAHAGGLRRIAALCGNGLLAKQELLLRMQLDF